jgi:hypothetical protein
MNNVQTDYRLQEIVQQHRPYLQCDRKQRILHQIDPRLAD